MSNPTSTTAASSTLLTVPESTFSSSLSTSSPTGTRPFILVPLYIYPAPGAWDPLYQAAEAHAGLLDFYVVVNPANGPGAGVDLLPDANYVAALGRLTALPNVRVIGYVHCSYGLRELDDIVRDVERYAAWEGASDKSAGEPIIVDGIFIDETPSSTEYVQYLAALASAAKMILNRNVSPPNRDLAAISRALAKCDANDTTEAQEEGITKGSDNTPSPSPSTPAAAAALLPSGALTPSSSSAIVIYNPGVVVDPIFYQAADYVVAFENSCSQWTAPVVTQGFARLPRALLARSIPVAHSATGGDGRRAEAVGRLSRRAGEMGCLGLFVTSQPGYTAWCEGWAEFVEGVARRSGDRG